MISDEIRLLSKLQIFLCYTLYLFVYIKWLEVEKITMHSFRIYARASLV